MNHTSPRFEITWAISPTHDVYETSSFLSALSALSRSGDIALNLVPLRDEPTAPNVSLLYAREIASGRMRVIALEAEDRADVLHLPTLERVDVYFKRSFDPAVVAGLPTGVRSKILPTGLTFACTLPGSSWTLIRSAVLSLASAAAATPSSMAQEFSRLRHRVVQIVGILDASTWERSARDRDLGKVVFQTRIWPPESDPAIDRRQVNAERVRFVRALQDAFGERDRIGLIHTPFALETASEAVTSRKVSKRDYAHQLRTTVVAVNSHGLDGSGGFKISESLAAGVALVSQRFRFQLPEPLLEEVNFLGFETPEECIAQCRRLLSDRALASRMRDANSRYYREFVRPEKHALRLLDRAFSAADPVTRA